MGQFFHQNQEINIESIFNLLTLFKLCHCLTNVLYRKIILKKKKKQKQKNLLDQDPIQHHTLPFLINLISINLEEFFSLSLCFISWHFWRLHVTYYTQCPSEWVCLAFPHNCIQVMHFWQECHIPKWCCQEAHGIYMSHYWCYFFFFWSHCSLRNLSFPTRNWIYSPAVKAHGLNHRTAREVQLILILITWLRWHLPRFFTLKLLIVWEK